MNKIKSQEAGKVKISSLNKNEVSITGTDDIDDIIYYYKSKAEHAVNFDKCIQDINDMKEEYLESLETNPITIDGKKSDELFYEYVLTGGLPPQLIRSWLRRFSNHRFWLK